jgi:hypothetical protein
VLYPSTLLVEFQAPGRGIQHGVHEIEVLGDIADGRDTPTAGIEADFDLSIGKDDGSGRAFARRYVEAHVFSLCVIVVCDWRELLTG